MSLGLYFGLRASGPPPSSPLQPSPSPAPGEAASSGAKSTSTSVTVAPPAETSSTPTPVPVAHDEIVRRAEEAAAKHKSHLVEACWTPIGKTSPSPDREVLTLTATFGADGKQIVRGVSEPRPGRPGLGACVQRELPNLEIDPPGQTVEIPVRVSFP